ncbi:MAG: Gfo/Idh/MocA family protein [Acidimicrobiales bacterium]|jgi:predicted dehydrogenase
MSDKLGVALVGCGGIARCHAFALTRVPQARLVATVDINEAAAIDFKERFGFEEHSASLDQVLDRPDVDAVVITTSNKTHAPLSVQAMRAGKHVMVQKPMAMNLAEAREMVAVADENNVKLMVSFFELFLPPVERAKAIIDAGLIGAPFFFKAIMAWHMPDNALGWRFDPQMSGGGVIMDGNVHHVSNALFLLAEPEVTSVYAEYATLTTNSLVEDTAVVLMRTPTALCEISGSNRLWEPGGTVPNFKDSWQVFGTKGTIQWDSSQRPTMRVFSSDEKVTDPLLGGGWVYPRLPLTPEDQRAYSMHLNGEENPWVPEHAHFVEACLTGAPLRSDGRFGLKTQAVLEAAYQSGKEGRRLPVATEVPRRA